MEVNSSLSGELCFLDKFQLDDLIDILVIIEKLFVDKEREYFIDIAKEMICKEVENYCTEVPAESYEIDINAIVNESEDAGYSERYYIEAVAQSLLV